MKQLNLICQRRNFQKGFTLPEVLVVVGVLLILLVASVPAFQFFKKGSDLDNTAEEMINVFRLAQSETLASKGSSQYGVYLATSSFPQQYVLYKGASYAGRDVQADEIHSLPKSIEIAGTDLLGAEIVFEKLTGKTIQYGSIVLQRTDDPSKTTSVYVERSGQVGLNSSASISDENRIKDSRHIYIDYSRMIAIPTEKISLTFEDGSTTTIPIAENIIDNQFFWEGEINVSGSIQKIKIHTLRLNYPDTQFSIHRDRRYNDKALRVDVDDTPDIDPGSLAEYSSDGLTATSTSLYVANFQWQ